MGYAWKMMAVAAATMMLGCGGAAGGAAPMAPPAEPAPTPEAPAMDAESGAGDKAEEAIDDVDAAARAFELAESDLDATLVAGRAVALDDDNEAAAPTGADATTPAPAPPKPAAKKAEPTAIDRCTRVCRALASMTRASDRLCSLAGAEDPRCTNCRERVSQAREKVTQSCASCG